MFISQIFAQISQKLLKIGLLLIGGQIAKKAVSVFHKKIRLSPKSLNEKASEKRKQRLKTLNSLIANTGKLAINFVVFLMILSELGVDIIPLVTGAGILGLAIGFGAKSLVADLIAGFFIIFEDQFNVGDLVQIGTSTGVVKKITLRTITLKNEERKAIIIMPNSTIKTVIKILPKKSETKP